MSWDYSMMSKEAAKAGGPKQWINKIKLDAYNQGVADTKNKISIPLFVLGVGVGIATMGATKLGGRYSKEKNNVSEVKKDAKEAEELLMAELEHTTENKCEEE